MRRNLDLVRSLLLCFEAMDLHPSRVLFIRGGADPRFKEIQATADEIDYHVALMEERELIDIPTKTMDGGFGLRKLTWEGHDFLDSVRDDEVWRKTRRGAEDAGAWTFDLIKDLAKGFVKKQIEQRTGVLL